MEQLVNQFKLKYLELVKPTKTKLVSIFKEILLNFLNDLEKNNKQNIITLYQIPQINQKQPCDYGLNTWSKLWLSKNFGGKCFFSEEYNEIKNNIKGEKKTEYRILTLLLNKVYQTNQIQLWYQSIATKYDKMDIFKILPETPFLNV